MSLLGPESLNGVCVGVSVSDSADLARLGLLEEHFRLALGEIARAVLTAGGELAYGGYIDGDGYGAFLASELQRFAPRDQPFHAVLALSEHRRVPVTKLKTFAENLGLYGSVICLDADGGVVGDPYADRSDGPSPVDDPEEVARGLTAMRRFATANTHGRILIGGRRAGYLGKLPGVIEELLLAAEVGQPVYLAGGYGGATADMANALVLNNETWFPQGEEMDDRYRAAMDSVQGLDRTTRDACLDNGLSLEEQRRLAVTHRASEIAALVSLGLGRRFAGELA